MRAVQIPCSPLSDYMTSHLVDTASLLPGNAHQLKQDWQWPQLTLAMKERCLSNWRPTKAPKMLSFHKGAHFFAQLLIFLANWWYLLSLLQNVVLRHRKVCKMIWHCSALRHVKLLVLTWDATISTTFTIFTSSLMFALNCPDGIERYVWNKL